MEDTAWGGGGWEGLGNNGLYNQIPETYPLVHSPPFLLIYGNMRIHRYCSSEEKKLRQESKMCTVQELLNNLSGLGTD